MHRDAKGQKVFFPKKSHAGYYDHDLKVRFHDAKHKAEYLQKHGLYETPTGITNKTRHVENVIESLNHDRERRGLKPLSKQECVGDGPNSGKIRKSVYFTGWRGGK